MSNEMAIFQNGSDRPMAEAFKSLAMTEMVNDLSGGVAGNYAILSMRGSKWRIKYQGNETPIIDAKGDGIPSLEAVIIKANGFLTKQFYQEGYQEGDSAAPVCFSLDGKVPAPGVPARQHDNCALCPQNKFGSKITPAGVQVKACQDNRKIAVVPLNDIENKVFGGPMLFRVPASALKDLATFGQTMSSRGYTYNAVGVRLGFDMDASYPKPTFKAIRPLTDEEAAQIIEMYNSDLVERVLAGEATMSAASAAPAKNAAEDQDFEIPPPPAQAAPTAQPVPPKPAKVVKPPAAQAPVTTGFGSAAPAPAKAATKPKAAKPAETAPPAPPAPPVAQEAAEEAETAGAPEPSGLDNDIASILAELNAAA